MDKKTARKEARKAANARLGGICETLQDFTRKCTSLRHQLRTKTTDTITSIERYFQCYPNIKEAKKDDNSATRLLDCLRHFLKQWFISFLAFKDEAMVLLKGELSRPYHLTEHKEFIHTRGAQSLTYKGTVSACSVDGWRYEYNQTKSRLGESETLEGYAERVDAVADSLDDIIAAMDESGKHMYTSLLAMKPALISVTMEFSSKGNKHMGESMRVELVAGTAEREPKVVSLKRIDAQHISRKDGLSTVLDDLPRADLPTAGTALGSNASSTLNVAVSLRRKVIVTEDDLENEVEEKIRLQREADALEKRRKAKESSFAMKTVSLDAIKRHYGQIRLLSTAKQHSINDEASTFDDLMVTEGGDVSEEENYESEDDSDSEGRGNVDIANSKKDRERNNLTRKHTGESRGQSNIQASASHRAAMRAIHKGRTCAVLTLHAGLPTPAVRILKMLVDVPTGMQAQMNRSCIEVDVDVTWGDGWSSSSASDTPRCVAVADLLDETFRRLWSYMDDGKQNPWPLFPIALVLLDKGNNASECTYDRGDAVPLPVEGEGHSFKVMCEAHPDCCVTLQSIGAAVSAAHAEQVVSHTDEIFPPVLPLDLLAEQAELLAAAQKYQPIVPNYELLSRLLDALKVSSASTTMTATLNVDMARLSAMLYHHEYTLLLLLTHMDELRIGNGKNLRVDLSGTDMCGTLMVEFMRSCTQVTAKNCSLDAYELRACATMLEARGADNGEEELQNDDFSGLGKRVCSQIGPVASIPQLYLPRAIPLEVLSLESNYLFSAFNDAIEIPVGPTGTVSSLRLPLLDTFLTVLFLSSPALMVLDVSHCCSMKPRGQALALCSALLQAVRLRVEAGLNPLQKIDIRGLRSLVTQAKDTKYDIDIDVDFVQKVHEVMPGCVIDVSGINRVL